MAGKIHLQVRDDHSTPQLWSCLVAILRHVTPFPWKLSNQGGLNGGAYVLSDKDKMHL